MRVKLMIFTIITTLMLTLSGCATGAPAWIVIPNSDPQTQYQRFLSEGWDAFIETFDDGFAIVDGVLAPEGWEELDANSQITIHLAEIIYLTTEDEAKDIESSLKEDIKTQADNHSNIDFYWVVSRNNMRVSAYIRLTGTVADLIDFLAT